MSSAIKAAPGRGGLRSEKIQRKGYVEKVAFESAKQTVYLALRITGQNLPVLAGRWAQHMYGLPGMCFRRLLRGEGSLRDPLQRVCQPVPGNLMYPPRCGSARQPVPRVRY